MFQLIQRTKSLQATVTTIESFLRMKEFAHIISLNPENLVEATKNADFKTAYDRADVVIADGVGIRIAAKVLGIASGDRITGIDLMSDLVRKYHEKNIVFLGGYHNTARQTMDHFAAALQKKQHTWVAYSDIDKDEPGLIEKVVAAKPDLLFVAFGSPAQEIWIEKYRNQLHGTVCMGVGQSFDVYGGRARRAPDWLQNLGLEWVFRLITQPWRWRRQLRLLEFIYLIIRYRFSTT